MNDNQLQWFSEQELIQFSKEQENEYIEKTESLETEKIAKTICAFANDLSNRRKPAVLFIGITDRGEYTTRSITDKLQLKIADIRSNGHLQPIPVIKVQKLSIEQHEILAIQVQPY